MSAPATIAIVGRPNVGKSTLFNRLTGTRHSITTEIPGTTRDRISHRFECHGYETILVDTGGLEYGKQENIEENIQAQANIAINDANLIIFTIDASQDLTVDDFSAANILRKSKKPVILVANKCDNPQMENEIFNLYELGFDIPISISAIHKIGIEELEYQISKKLQELKFPKKSLKKDQDDTIDLCILGKPNAGKSSLVNALIGAEKTIVSEIPGTTRDSTDTEIIYEEQHYNLIDTAGLRRRGKIERGIERYSAIRAINAIERSDIVILLIDAAKNLTNQDTHILQHALEAEKGIVIAINKSDLLEKGEETRNRIIGRLRRRLAFIPWAPVIFISAKNKRNTYQIFNLANTIMDERRKRIVTNKLNSFLQKITFKHPPASTKNKKPRFMYATQPDSEPPRFVFFFKHANNIHFSYKRYLENEIRKEYGFNGTAIHLTFRNKHQEAIPKS